MDKKTSAAQEFEYKAEMKQLLHLIVHSLYTHPEVFLRELISNSADALNKVRFRKLTDKNILDFDANFEIKIELDSKKKIFSIEDNGIGMRKDDLINGIGTVARSGTIEFLKKVKEQNKTFDEELIGQFGVGFYSVFMVAEEVTIETRHADIDSKALRWRSKGEGNFTIEEIDRKKRGTKVYFTLKKSAEEFCEEYKIKNTINKYSNFVNFPIILKNEKINKVIALWHKSTKEIMEGELNDFYKFISNDSSNPLGHLHLSLEGSVNFKALIFIPQEAPFDLFRIQNEKSLHLYSNKILIQNDCKDLLPEYLQFLKGVVDTSDLPLNVSREITQNSPIMAKIRKTLTARTLSLLKDWSNTDRQKYKKFYKNFGSLFKTGINTDFDNKDKIIELLRFETTQSQGEELVSLKEYVSRIKPDQKDIYYLSGENKEAIMRNPNLEYFKKNEIEVLLLTDPVDVFTVPSIGEYDKKSIKSIDKADIDLMPQDRIEKPNDNLSKSLLSLFKDILKDKVSDVVSSKRLVSSAVTLVASGDGLDPQMEKMMKIMNKNYSSSKKTMEINMLHPLVKNLAKIHIANSKDPLLEQCILQLYEGALFLDGNLSTATDFIKRMTDLMEEATAK